MILKGWSFLSHNNTNEMAFTCKGKTSATIIKENNKLIIDKDKEVVICKKYLTECFNDYQYSIDKLDGNLDELYFLAFKLLEWTR